MSDTQYTITSSHGTLTANSAGEVIHRSLNSDGDEDSPHLDMITRFDFDEWRKYWRKSMPATFDILDLGYWYTKDVDTGKEDYEAAADDWREDCAKANWGRQQGFYGMRMEERHDHARAALIAYRKAKGEPVTLDENADDFEDTDAADLIADLLHLQVKMGFDVELTLERAKMHHDEEQADDDIDGKGGANASA